MNDEAFCNLQVAREQLRLARTRDMPSEALRDACRAAYHAAQAYIINRTGMSAKTAANVFQQFDTLTQCEPLFDAPIKQFLASSLVPAPDQQPLERAATSAAAAADAIAKSARFIERVAYLLGHLDAK
jgi:hypothetical protein